MRSMRRGSLTIREEAEALVIKLRRLQGRQVTSKPFKREIAAFVNRYFELERAKLSIGRSSEAPNSLDGKIQDLLRCTHRKTVKSKYSSLLRQIITILRELEVASLAMPREASARVATQEKEAAIIDTLRKLVPAAADSLQQGLIDLSSKDRVSWRGTVVEFRESLREVLDHLAPDEDVISMPGYKQEKDTHGPTMKQKVMYILRFRQAPESKSKPLADNVAVVDELVGNMVRSVYQRASKATHVAADRKEASRVRDYVVLALSEILEVNE